MLRSDARLSPREMIASHQCIGCGSCVALARRADVAMAWDAHGQLAPRGPAAWMKEPTASLAGLCPFSPHARDEDDLAEACFPRAPFRDARIGRYEAAYVGHADEAGFRENGSSGGMVSWVAAELMRLGLVDGVAHVVPSTEGALFRYRISRSAEEIRAGARSRYHPIELSGVLDEIRATPGRYAVIGIPCFIKAVQLLRAEDALFRERIVATLGLFCGHMKSARFVESFAWQMGVRPPDVRGVEYRVKDPGRPANWYRAELSLNDGSRHQRDWWHLVDGDWGAGFFQHPACDLCDDVVAETADISFGDAWTEPYSADGRGTNVVVVRTPGMHDLLRRAIAENRVGLDKVDADFVAGTQAAGLRHRREGLAYRLARMHLEPRPRKRVGPDRGDVPARRRLIYGLRYRIAAWSHRVFAASRGLGRPGLYLGWARAVLTLYHALAYSRGRLGRAIDRIAAWP